MSSYINDNNIVLTNDTNKRQHHCILDVKYFCIFDVMFLLCCCWCCCLRSADRIKYSCWHLPQTAVCNWRACCMTLLHQRKEFNALLMCTLQDRQMCSGQAVRLMNKSERTAKVQTCGFVYVVKKKMHMHFCKILHHPFILHPQPNHSSSLGR